LQNYEYSSQKESFSLRGEKVRMRGDKIERFLTSILSPGGERSCVYINRVNISYFFGFCFY
jgi:hypothetical protein